MPASRPARRARSIRPRRREETWDAMHLVENDQFVRWSPRYNSACSAWPDPGPIPDRIQGRTADPITHRQRKCRLAHLARAEQEQRLANRLVYPANEEIK